MKTVVSAKYGLVYGTAQEQMMTLHQQAEVKVSD